MIDAESLDLEEFTIVVAAQEEADTTETVDFCCSTQKTRTNSIRCSGHFCKDRTNLHSFNKSTKP